MATKITKLSGDTSNAYFLTDNRHEVEYGDRGNPNPASVRQSRVMHSQLVSLRTTS